ncbi:hypothetical protein [Sphingobium sp. EM0848]|uniref:hypothetical protein n=1 Tax=Sphingobium sp. EM0848 TaxID=2743473 RepID=UPI00159C2A4A|nr:hypothetical protein [Sphingobium sp. EM0848]
MTVAFGYWQLSLEAAEVISLRLPKLMTGDSAAAFEAQRMVAEKIEAVALLNWKAMTGALGTTPLSMMQRSTTHYRQAVDKNRRRLKKR